MRDMLKFRRRVKLLAYRYRATNGRQISTWKSARPSVCSPVVSQWGRHVKGTVQWLSFKPWDKVQPAPLWEHVVERAYQQPPLLLMVVPHMKC